MFAEKSKLNGNTNTKEMKDLFDWAWKFEVADYYVSHTLMPKVEKVVQIDTVMCLYAHWDEIAKPGIMPDSATMFRIIDPWKEKLYSAELDGEILAIRKKVGVTWLQTDWNDKRDLNPATLMAEADSLINANQAAKGEVLYKEISEEFPSTDQGVQSLFETAKINAENERYAGAIQYYREFLVKSKDHSKRYNTFFMIGFINDEYLNKAPQAEVNYKWILKNDPTCELADDAEFMTLHLDEPMIGVDELQAEAKRQGRKLDETAPVAETADTTAAAATKKL
jgi:hypothetical protein